MRTPATQATCPDPSAPRGAARGAAWTLLLMASLGSERLLSADGLRLAVITADGRELRGVAETVAPDLSLRLEAETVSLPWTDALRIEPVRTAQDDSGTAGPSPARPPLTFALSDGSRFAARVTRDTAGGFEVQARGAALLEVDLTNVREIVAAGFEAAAQARFGSRPAEAQSTEDVVLVSGGDTIRSLPGVIRGVDADGLRFEWKGRALAIPWSKLAAARFGRPLESRRPSRVWLRDGDRFAGRVLAGDLRAIELRTAGSAVLDITWADVLRVENHSERVQYLSEQAPADYRFEPFFEKRWEYALDRDLSGKPIRLGQREYERGVCLHSQARLTYALPGDARLFVATVGVLDDMRPRGDAVVRVIGDGRMIWEQRIRGSDPPRALAAPIEGVRRLTLVVEFGEDLDLSDQVCFADARLIR